MERCDCESLIARFIEDGKLPYDQERINNLYLDMRDYMESNNNQEKEKQRLLPYFHILCKCQNTSL